MFAWSCFAYKQLETSMLLFPPGAVFGRAADQPDKVFFGWPWSRSVAQNGAVGPGGPEAAIRLTVTPQHPVAVTRSRTWKTTLSPL